MVIPSRTHPSSKKQVNEPSPKALKKLGEEGVVGYRFRQRAKLNPIRKITKPTGILLRGEV